MSARIKLTCCAVFATGILAASAMAVMSAPKLVVLEKSFYGEIITDGQRSHKRFTNRIPNVANKVCFGWVIKITPRDELVKITEIFTLPAAPKQWEGVEDDPYSQTTTSNDRKVATTNRFMALGKGELKNSWCISEGDPSGTHQIIVLYDTQVLAEFEFEVYD